MTDIKAAAAHSKTGVDQSIFIPSVIVIILASLTLILFPEVAGKAAQSARTFVTTTLTWLYLIAGVGAFSIRPLDGLWSL